MKRKRNGTRQGFRYGLSQISRVMRIVIFILLVGFMHVSASVKSQSSVNLNLKNVTLEEALGKVEKQLKQSFFFNREYVDVSRKVNLQLIEANLDELVRRLFGKEFKYRVVDNIIVVSPQAEQQGTPAGLRITGTVRDKSGSVLPGVTVLIKGTRIGVATDVEGKYALTVPEGDHVLVFSMIGMENKEERVGKRTQIDVVLEEVVNELENVVVTGYFNQNKSSFTGAAKSFTAEQLQQGSNQNILTALQNLDPSFVKIENNLAGSNPNVMPDFQIRGAGSISGMEDEYEGNPNMPVFIVDGFEMSAEKVFDLDPYRVASITLLKDAAATAIYGSRASNGVVVITTNAPADGKMSVSYNMDASFYMADLSDYNLCNAEEKLEIEKRAGMYSSTNISQQFEAEKKYSDKLAKVRMGYNTYWLDKPLDPVAVANKHSLRLDGGNDYIRYAMEVNYSNTPGVMKESGRKRFGLGMDLQYSYKNLIFKNRLTYSNVRATNSPYGAFSKYARLNPYVRYKDDEGNYIYKVDEFIPIGVPGQALYHYNPLFNTTLNTIDENKYNDITDNFGIDWTVIEGLRVKGNFSFTRQNTFDDKFKPAKHTDFAKMTGDDFDRRGSYSGTRGESFSYDASLILTYFWQHDKHVINTNLGWNLQESTEKTFTVDAEGFPNENLDYVSFATQYKKAGKPGGSEYTSRLVGFLGNLNYSYDERYLLDLSFREDASSRFGGNNRWAPFWSAGLGWNLHNESFLKNAGFIDRFKLRGSYGLTGSQNYNPYQAMTTYKYLTGERYHNAVGTELMAMGNENLGWQRTLQQNYGVDIDLWNSRINITGDYYIKVSKDVLTSVTLPPSLGFSSYMDNLGEVKNAGFELSLRVALLKDTERRLYWSIHGNAVHNTNKLMKISNALQAYNDTQDAEMKNKPKVRYVEGQSMNSIWVNRSLGVDPATGKELFLAKNGDIVMQWSALNYVIGGCTDPDVEGTFGTNFSYKGFSLNMIFRYRVGGEAYNQTLVDKVQDADLRYNVDRRVYEQRWEKAGDQVMFTGFGGYYGANIGVVTKPTSRFIEKNNYLEMSTLNLSYEFQGDWLKRIGVKRLKALFYMNDVFRASSIQQERGIDYPFARNFSVGLQVRL